MYLTIVITILMPETEHARSDVFREDKKRQILNEPQQYCGASLSSTLQVICRSVYNTRFKKSNQGKLHKLNSNKNDLSLSPVGINITEGNRKFSVVSI